MSQPSPSRSELTAELAALYVLSEQRLLEGASRIIRETLPTLAGQATALSRLRTLVAQIVTELVGRSSALVVAMVNAAASEGSWDATVAVRKALERFTAGSGGGAGLPPGSALVPEDDPFNLSLSHGERAAQAIRDSLTDSLQDVRFRITRLPDDIYKAIAPHGAIRQVLANDVTPAQAQAMAWRVFVSQGVRGFTDKSGREWSLSAYTEMAVRTAAARAYNDSHLARMRALGVRYFTVAAHLGSCPLCLPWQNAIISDGVIENPELDVKGTLDEAIFAGLFHPNCEHTLLPVFPGVTVLDAPQLWDADRQVAYELTQTQRRLELAVRKAKRQLEYAVSPEMRAEAWADVRAAQAKVREFVRVHGLARQSRREQIDLTDARIKLPTPIR